MDFNDNSKPIYLQLADQLMDDLQRGLASPGDRLLSVRDYGAKVGVNANTVMRTYTWLQQEEIIYNKRGIGYFYSDDARERVMNMRRRDFYNREMPRFIRKMQDLGITAEEFINHFNSQTPEFPII